jgi:hypothetical protein
MRPVGTPASVAAQLHARATLRKSRLRRQTLTVSGFMAASWLRQPTTACSLTAPGRQRRPAATGWWQAQTSFLAVGAAAHAVFCCLQRGSRVTLDWRIANSGCGPRNVSTGFSTPCTLDSKSTPVSQPARAALPVHRCVNATTASLGTPCHHIAWLSGCQRLWRRCRPCGTCPTFEPEAEGGGGQLAAHRRGNSHNTAT